MLFPFRARAACLVTAATVFLSCGSDPVQPPPPAAVSVTVTPASATIGAGGTQSLTATVTNATNQGVTWTASAGVIIGTGATVTYTAPVTGGNHTVTATSSEDGTKSGSATITVTSVAVAVTPTTDALFRGESATFTATVTGSDSAGVTWASTCGTATATGSTYTYTAPDTVATCTVTATSAFDPAMSAAAQVTVRSATAVTAADDVDDGTCDFAHCSLREAIMAVAAGDTIYLGTAAAPRTVQGGSGQKQAQAMTITLTNALPTITVDMTIIGEGSGLTTIDVNASVANPRRGFTISGSNTVEIQGLTVTGGVAAGGGAVMLLGTAHGVLTDVTLDGNTAQDGEGGGLLATVNTRATLTDTHVDNNETIGATRPGGGISMHQGTTLIMSGGSVSGNIVNDGWGGGIRAIGVDSIIMNNVMILDDTVVGGVSRGGGFYTETSGFHRLTNVTISGGTAPIGGGAYFNTNTVAVIDSSTIDGNAASTLAGGMIVLSGAQVTATNSSISNNTSGGSTGGLLVNLGGIATLTNVNVDGNQAGTFGGGINVLGTNSVLTMNGGTVSGNTSQGAAGGLIKQTTAVLSMTDVTVDNNTAVAGTGGGLLLIGIDSTTLDRMRITGNTAGINGGGVVPGSTVLITNSVISGNTAAMLGGGVFGGGTSTTVPVLRNVTVSGNNADIGGGVTANNFLTLVNSTIVGNTAVTSGGGIQSDDLGDVTMTSTLVSGNLVGGAAANCATGGATVGIFTSSGYNLSDDATCAALTMGTDLNNTAAGVDPALADNGGLTMTHALQTGSMAIDKGDPASCPVTDQRGYSRSGVCDIGAFEFAGTAPFVANALRTGVR